MVASSTECKKKSLTPSWEGVPETATKAVSVLIRGTEFQGIIWSEPEGRR